MASVLGPLLLGRLRAEETRGAGRSVRLYSPVLELRQYALQPGKREAFVALFESLIEDVEAAGADVVGQFLDLDHPDRFVWLRGYADMDARVEMITSFFNGPVWRANRQAINAILQDASNVLLLRPAHEQSGFLLDSTQRPARDAHVRPDAVIVATLYYFDRAPPPRFLDYFATTLAPALTEAGAAVRASFVTLERPNNFPQHPIRENEHVFAWFATFPDEAAHRQFVAFTRDSQRWQRELVPELNAQTAPRRETLRLKPTARSLLRL